MNGILRNDPDEALRLGAPGDESRSNLVVSLMWLGYVTCSVYLGFHVNHKD